MRLTRYSVLIAAGVVLAGCATSEERCIQRATSELRTIDALILETEANLSRGYAIERETTISPRLTFCTGYRDRVGVNFCTSDRLVERERAVAIDPISERRKLSDLRARRSLLEGQARQAAAACAV